MYENIFARLLVRWCLFYKIMRWLDTRLDSCAIEHISEYVCVLQGRPRNDPGFLNLKLRWKNLHVAGADCQCGWYAFVSV